MHSTTLIEKKSFSETLAPEFKIWRTNRSHYIDVLQDYSLEQLNKIPGGFKNNLIWNIGHAVATQQGLIYALSGHNMNISETFYEKYKSDSVPTQDVTKEEVQEMKILLTSLREKTEVDYEAGIFNNYTEITTSTRFNIASFDEAVKFNNYHEGLHLGYLFSMRKLV